MAIRPLSATPAGTRPMDGGTHTQLLDSAVPMNSRADARLMVTTIPWADDPGCVDCVADHREKPAPKANGTEVCIGHSRARAKRARIQAEKQAAEQARVDKVSPPPPTTASEVHGGPRIEDSTLDIVG